MRPFEVDFPHDPTICFLLRHRESRCCDQLVATQASRPISRELFLPCRHVAHLTHNGSCAFVAQCQRHQAMTFSAAPRRCRGQTPRLSLRPRAIGRGRPRPGSHAAMRSPGFSASAQTPRGTCMRATRSGPSSVFAQSSVALRCARDGDRGVRQRRDQTCGSQWLHARTIPIRDVE